MTPTTNGIIRRMNNKIVLDTYNGCITLHPEDVLCVWRDGYGWETVKLDFDSDGWYIIEKQSFSRDYDFIGRAAHFPTTYNPANYRATSYFDC